MQTAVQEHEPRESRLLREEKKKRETLTCYKKKMYSYFLSLSCSFRPSVL